MQISFERSLTLDPDVPVVVAAEVGFSPLGELWPQLERFGVTDKVDALCTQLNSSPHVLVGRMTIPAAPRCFLVLTPSTDSRVYVERWSRRQTWRPDIWKDFVYAVTSVASRLAAAVSQCGTIRLAHLTPGGWPPDAALASLEAIHHLSVECVVQACVFGGCCIDDAELGRYYADVLRGPATSMRLIKIQVIQDSPDLHVARLSLPVGVGGRLRPGL